MNEKQFIDQIQTLLEDFIKDDQPLAKEAADKLADRMFALEPMEKENASRRHHQTVRIYRDGGEWVPITIYFETDEMGRVDFIRIHSRRFIEEYRN